MVKRERRRWRRLVVALAIAAGLWRCSRETDEETTTPAARPSILLVTLDDEGRFVSGRIEATTQIRPAGPSLDPSKGVIKLLQTLTTTAFPAGELSIGDDGTLAKHNE